VKWLAATLISFGLCGCTFTSQVFEDLRANRALAARDYGKLFAIYDKVIEDDPDSPRALEDARKGARIAHLEAKNYEEAVEYYKHIILRSPDPEERKTAQRYVAQIYFENLQDYDRAVIEYEKLLKFEGGPEEGFRYRLNLAKCHFALNNLEQTLAELDVILAQKLSPEHIFEAKVLKANVFMAHKQLSEAAVLWQSIMDEFPDRAKKENVALNLVVCYEESKDFGKAIDVLEKMKTDYPNPDFLNLRIERLKERKQNLPGAQGFKR
jgi:tetratricopeptide (TPR) repeat protein